MITEISWSRSIECNMRELIMLSTTLKIISLFSVVIPTSQITKDQAHYCLKVWKVANSIRLKTTNGVRCHQWLMPDRVLAFAILTRSISLFSEAKYWKMDQIWNHNYLILFNKLRYLRLKKINGKFYLTFLIQPN